MPDERYGEELGFAIDGGVVKIDSLRLQDELGVVGGEGGAEVVGS